MGPLVSIITPVYNSEKYISETIKSVINQYYTNWELLIVDDCSTDSTVEIIKTFLEIDDRIQLIKLSSNSGHPSIPRNRAIEIANGKYISFLDSDDLWLPNKLLVQVNYMEEHKLLFSHMSYSICDEMGRLQGRAIKIREEMTYSDLLKLNGIGCLTVMYNAEILGKRYFIPNIIQEDFIHWIDLCSNFESIIGISNVQSIYRVRRNSLSSNKLKMAMGNWRIYYSYLNLGFLKSIYYFSCFSTYWLCRRLNL